MSVAGSKTQWPDPAGVSRKAKLSGYTEPFGNRQAGECYKDLGGPLDTA